jgi:hypothetical protein
MKSTSAILWIVAVFLLPVTVIYWIWSKDPTGTTALALTFGLSVMIAYYLWFTARRMDLLPQDNEEGEVIDDAGELGFFAPHSWQPLMLAGGCALLFLGVIFGWWLALFAAPLVCVGVFGWVFEFYLWKDRRY